jgi:diadenosine tetraphosphate (Ap4A) HIT family hydrolase
MPRLITRAQALARLEKEIQPGECLGCAVNRRKDLVLIDGTHAMALLSHYPRNWGHTAVFLKRHVTHLSSVSPGEWLELNEQVRRVGVALEQVLRPLRVFLACTGSVEKLPMTCPHIHFNLIPVYSAADKPSSIFTWENGIYEADPAEWDDLFSSLREVI